MPVGSIPTTQQKEQAQSINLMGARPLDAREAISEELNIDTELPVAQRYDGQQIIDQAESRRKQFYGGTGAANLVKVALTKNVVEEATIDLSATDTFTLIHNCGSIDLNIMVWLEGVTIPFVATLLADTDPNYLNHVILDFSQWKTDTGLTTMPAGMKAVIVF